MQGDLKRFPVGMNDNADVSLYAEARCLAMVGLAPIYPGIGTRAFWKKIVQLDALFPPSGQISGIFQYTGDTISGDKILVIKNGSLYTCAVSANAPQPTPECLKFTSTSLVAVTNNSGINFTAGSRVRAVQFNTEMIFVQAAGMQPVRYNGTALYKLGITTPAAPTDGGNAVGSGGLTQGAVYKYAITYADELGRESSPSSYLSVTMGAGGGRVINWTLPTDAQVQRIYLYRSTAGGALLYRVVEDGFNNATNTWSDTSVSASDTLITLNTGAPLPGENDPPLPASMISTYKFRIALNGVSNPRLLQLSNLSTPSQFSQLGAIVNSNGQLLNATDGITFNVINKYGDEITGLKELGSGLGIYNRRSIGILLGDNPSQYSYLPVHKKGNISTDSVCETGNGTTFMAEDGLYILAYENGFMIKKLSDDMDKLFRSAAVRFDPPGDWPPSTFYSREQRAEAAVGEFIQNRYVLATPPYTVVYDFDHNSMFLDYMTGMPYDGSMSKGYLCMSRIFANREYEVILYSPGFGTSSGASGNMYVMSYYPLTQDALGVPEPYDFIYQTRAIDGKGVARRRMKRFKMIYVFGSIEPMRDSDGDITAEALFNGTLTLTTDTGREFSYPFDNLIQFSTDYSGVSFARSQKQGALIIQQLPQDCTGRIGLLTIQGSANGFLNLNDVYINYDPLSEDAD